MRLHTTPQWKWRARLLLRRKRGGQHCRCCGTQMQRSGNSPQRETLDHIVPRSRGGSNDIENLRLVCSSCNNDLPGHGDCICALVCALAVLKFPTKEGRLP